jgi:hypothetical protein
MTNTGAIEGKLETIAENAHQDALEILQLIAIMRAQNTGGVNKNISKAGGGRAAMAMRNALISRLTLLVTRCFAKPKLGKDGDLSARKGWDIIRKDARLNAKIKQQNLHGVVTSADVSWLSCLSDARLQRIEHFRDKYTAHISEPDPDIPLPTYDELFPFAEETAKALQTLANIIRASSDNLNAWDEELKGSAEAVWKPWANKDAPKS